MIRRSSLAVLIFWASSIFASRAKSSEGVELKLKLQGGWNPVVVGLEPDQLDPKALFHRLIEKGELLSVWSFVPGEGWSRFDVSERPGDVPKPPGPPDLDQGSGEVKVLKAIVAGRSYWVELRDSVPAGGVDFPYRARLAQVAHPLKSGWNFIGFHLESPVPADQLLPSQPPLQPAQPPIVQAILHYDRTSRALKRWEPGAPWPSFEPGQAYWVRVGQDVTLRPRLGLALTPDVAVRRPGEARSNNTIPGDTDFNRNGILENETSQDTVFIDALATAGSFVVRNAGDGSLSYRVDPAGCWKSPVSPEGGYPAVLTDQRGELHSAGWTPVDPEKVPWLTVEGPMGVSPALDGATGLAQRDRLVTLTPRRDELRRGLTWVGSACGRPAATGRSSRS